MKMSLTKFSPRKRIAATRCILSCAVPALLCTLIVSCSSLHSEKGSWEGFRDGTLRVFVRYNYIDGIDGTINRATDDVLLDTGRIRAETVLICFLRVGVSFPAFFPEVQSARSTVATISAQPLLTLT